MLAFDTHEFYKKLQKANFSVEQSEAITDLVRETQRQSFEEVSENLASKEDIHTIKEDMSSLRAELKEDMSSLRAELKEDIHSLDKKIEKTKSDLELKIEQTKNSTIRWIVGLGFTLVLYQTGLALTLIKLFVK